MSLVISAQRSLLWAQTWDEGRGSSRSEASGNASIVAMVCSSNSRTVSRTVAAIAASLRLRVSRAGHDSALGDRGLDAFLGPDDPRRISEFVGRPRPPRGVVVPACVGRHPRQGHPILVREPLIHGGHPAVGDLVLSAFLNVVAVNPVGCHPTLLELEAAARRPAMSGDRRRRVCAHRAAGPRAEDEGSILGVATGFFTRGLSVRLLGIQSPLRRSTSPPT